MPGNLNTVDWRLGMDRNIPRGERRTAEKIPILRRLGPSEWEHVSYRAALDGSDLKSTTRRRSIDSWLPGKRGTSADSLSVTTFRFAV